MSHRGSKRKNPTIADVSRIEEALFNLEEMLTVPEAHAILKSQGFKFAKPAIIRWIHRYNIGFKVGGRFYVYPDRLALLLKGQKIQRKG